MKRMVLGFALCVLFLAGCGKLTEQDSSERFEEMEQQRADDATVTPAIGATLTPEAVKTPVPTPTVPVRQLADRSTPAPTVTPTSTPTPTSSDTPTNMPTQTPTPTIVPKDYGDDIFVFDREYTDEWAWIEVCFWLKDKDGNPLVNEWCELLVDEDYVMIKSPLVVDYYDTRQDAVTDEEGKVEFIILEQWGDGDRELNLTITTLNSRHTEKIYCVDPVRTVPTKPEVIVQQTEYIKLSWEKDYDARWYYIERKVNDGEYELIEKTDLYDWYGDYEVEPGNTYYYRVYGGNHVGYGEACEVCVPFVDNVFSHLSEEQVVAFLRLLEEGEAFLQRSRGSADLDEAVQSTVEFLRAKDGVAEVGISEGCSSIWFVTEIGIMGTISVGGDDKMD